MNRFKTAYAALAGSLLVGLGGCTHAPIPVAENFPYTAQKKVRSAGHWDAVAGHVVSTTLTRLGQTPAAGAALQVGLPASPTAFDRAFRELLITRLVSEGKTVVERDDAPIKVSYQAQVVRHNSDRPHFIPGLFTAITSGVYVAHYLGVHAHPDAAMVGGLGYAVIADVARSQYTGGPTHTEVILTTTIMQGDRYLVRNTDVYYVEDSDATLFQVVRGPASREFKVVSQ
ncbi:hypothetical protein [Tepidimonas sp.]|uniref:hypothetical protein n=1 Tax=Tepidimonas sp. TaxID=2002775 RepID=UPI002FE34B0D